MKREKIKKKKEINNILILCVLCVLCGCSSLIENIGKTLDGSNEKILSHYQSNNGINIYKVQNRNKEESMLISLNNYPMLRLRGTLPDESDNFYLTSLDYFSSYPQGWNEFSMALLGRGTFSANETLSFNEEIELVQITKGRIHRFDSRITGDDALTALNNRNDRILALVEWMKKYAENTSNEIVFTSITQFENYWKPIILPEIVNRKKRPENFRQIDDIFIRAEDIRWNTGYTERTFSEELRPIRDSGTILRDWEEALHWIYMEYEWENIVKLLSGTIQLIKVR